MILRICSTVQGFHNKMCEKTSIDRISLIKNENDVEADDCICGPETCKPHAIGNDELSLDSADEDEVVRVSLWESIIQQSNEKQAPYIEWLEEKKASEPTGIPLDGPAEFLDKEIFPLLLPAMRIMLLQAREWDALKIQKCRFNGLDFLAEVLWNRNPRHSKRSRNWLELFDIPPFKLYLKSNPRPIFPKSWLWTKAEGALIIQKWVRGWLVRKRDDVQEMRLFWKEIIVETKLEAVGLESVRRGFHIRCFRRNLKNACFSNHLYGSLAF